MKILVDMNMSPRWPESMQRAGIEAVHWSALGLAYADDSEIMAYAAEHGFAVFTNDLDFGHMLAMTGAEQPSVIQVRVGNLRPGVIGAQVIDAILQLRTELEEGALLTIDPERTRVKILPLQR